MVSTTSADEMAIAAPAEPSGGISTTAKSEIERECRSIDHRTGALLADHIEKTLHRTDRRAREQPHGKDEHQLIAVGESRTEQRQDGLAAGEQECGRDERRPERPVHRLAHELRKSLAVSSRMECANAMRGGRRDREVDEGDQRQRLHRRIVDGDIFRRPELLQHQEVGVGEQQVEAFGHQDRQRDDDPEPDVVRLRAGINALAEAAVELQHLSQRRQPDCSRRQHHRSRRVERQAYEPGGAHQHGEQNLTHDVGRHDAERDPVVGA